MASWSRMARSGPGIGCPESAASCWSVASVLWRSRHGIGSAARRVATRVCHLCLILTSQETIVVKGNDVGHKWLGCILSAGAIGRSTLDITYHLQAASRAFFANKQILCDKKVRLAVRLRFFDRVITPVALFASGHRTIRMSDL